MIVFVDVVLVVKEVGVVFVLVVLCCGVIVAFAVENALCSEFELDGKRPWFLVALCVDWVLVAMDEYLYNGMY